MNTINERINALSSFLSSNEGEYQEIKTIITKNPSKMVFNVNKQKYLVVTEDEAQEEFRNHQRKYIKECGLDGFTDSGKDYILNNFADSNKSVDWNEVIEWLVNDKDSRGDLAYYNGGEEKEGNYFIYRQE